MTLRRLAPALALALLPATAAQADDSHYTGDCSYSTINQETLTDDTWTGIAYANVVLYSRHHGNVVNATVTCEVRVDGVVRASVSQWGSGVVAFADTIQFTAGETDVVELCTTVDYTSDATPTTTDCGHATTTQFPPQEYIDFVNGILDWVNGAFVTLVDPAVCGSTGDVYVVGEVFYDCPPYQNPMPEPWPADEPPPLPPLPWTGEPFAPTGGGYNTGDAGFLLLTGTDREVASACAYSTDRATGTITVVGATATAGATAARIRCRLTDATGAPLYDETVPVDGPKAVLRGTIPAPGGPVTVCTEGGGEWAARTVTVGLYCRPGEPLGGRS